MGDYQSQLYDKLSALTGLGKRDRVLSAPLVASSKSASTSRRMARANDGIKMSPMRKAMAILIHYPTLARALPPLPELAKLDIPGMALFLYLIHTLRHKDYKHTGQILEYFRDHPDIKVLTKLAALELPLAEQEPLTSELLDIYLNFMDQYLEQRLQELILKERHHGLTKDEWREYGALIKELPNSSSKQPN